MKRTVIERRTSKYYESCWWSVAVADDTFKSDSNIKITIDKADRGLFYIYEGKARQNATFISDSTAKEDFTIKIDSGALIFFMSNKKRSGTGAFTVTV